MTVNLPAKLNEYLAADSIFRMIYDYTKTRFDAAPQLFAHNFEHARRDTLNAIAIGEVEGADMHIVLCAAVMHDIGYLYGAHRSVHGEVGAEHLAEYLQEGHIELEPPEFDHIQACIHTHKGVIHGDNPATIEAKVVADADHLDKFGPVGVYQMILSSNEFGQGVQGVLDRLPGRADKPFFTAAARRIAEPIKGFGKQFGADLQAAYAMYQPDQPQEEPTK